MEHGLREIVGAVLTGVLATNILGLVLVASLVFGRDPEKVAREQFEREHGDLALRISQQIKASRSERAMAPGRLR